MPKVSVSSEQLRRKFAAVTNSQDSIMATSQWILKQSKHLDEILECWGAQITKSDHEHRLTLLYLANDVVQNCRKRHPELIDKWQSRVESAFKNLTHHSIRSGVEKVVNVWATRSVFPKETIGRLKKTLDQAKGAHKDKAERALQDFKPADLAEALKEYSSCENDLRLKRELLQSSGLNGSDPAELLEKVKERGQGNRARQELQQWTQLLIEYVDLQEIHIERRRKLLSLVNQSCIFYQAQFHEVNVVLKAYKDYQERVLAQKKRCQEMMTTKFPTLFPDVSPIQSPTQSPIASPNIAQMDMKISDEDTANSSDDEQVENPLDAFFGPGKQERKTSQDLLAEGVGAEGDLDSRLANIFEKKKNENAPTGNTGQQQQPVDPNWVPPPPPRPKGAYWGSDSSSTGSSGGKWPPAVNNAVPPPPVPPPVQSNGQWPEPPRHHFPPPNFPQQQSGPPPRFPPHFGNRGGGGVGFMPRTPPNFNRPPNHQGFNSEGANRRGGMGMGFRGGFRGRGGGRGARW